ncbi:HAD family hydrolase [Evansella tamaricis]|uniref:HAD family hydrolase n=1 Tax=Evansella tamaricis TaxID=2069301 RepID=A0ABS6JKN5_9BACI|nr:HAD family hydrolase [Evansella tamaricis]MBU9714244.1 HAD family hydrolase [Evansella tamaricis]
MIKAVIFDCDGLLIDTETPWFLANRELYQEHGVDLPLELYAQCIGNPTFEDFDPYVNLKNQLNGSMEIDEMKAKARLIHKRIMKNQDLRPGVREYLESAKKRGYKIGLASSSDRTWIDEQLTKFNILHYFDSIHTGDTVEKVKPYPDLYLSALKNLEVKPHEAVAFEDSLNGLKAAKAAEIYCVVVPNEATSHLKFTNYDLKLESMQEFTLEQVVKKVIPSST